MAPAILWLASDAAAFVNGQDLAIDGDISAGRPGSVSAADRAAMAEVLPLSAEPRPRAIKEVPSWGAPRLPRSPSWNPAAPR